MFGIDDILFPIHSLVERKNSQWPLETQHRLLSKAHVPTHTPLVIVFSRRELWLPVSLLAVVERWALWGGRDVI